jgi:serine phosphatase RsbU (regulator of sigma subunit)
MKKIVSLISGSLLLSSLMAQQGSPLLTHYIESRDVENQSWAICQDEDQVMLFANRKGIIAFEGEEWMTVKIPTIPYSMQRNPADGKIYIGGDDNYGYLEKTDKISYRFVSLSPDSSGAGIISKIIFSNSAVWFYGEKSIIRYNTETGKTDLQLFSRPGSLFTGMIVTPKSTFINVMKQGLFRLESDTLFPIVTGYLTSQVDVLFSLPYNGTLVLVGLSNGSLSLFDGIKYYDYKVNDDGYLKENILSEGILLSDTAYAFSTLDGGALVIGKNNRKVLFTINNQSELPDDEVFAIGSDNSGGLWLSHQYGLTRADLNLPVENYTIFPGLKGNLSSALSYDNELYVATSEGLYYLSEIKSYSKIEVLVKNEPAARPINPVPKLSDQEQQGNRKNIFTRIMGKKSAQSENVPANTGESKPAATYTRKTVSKLKSIDHNFLKVAGLNEKCRQLVSTPFGILAATNKGLYNISKHKAVIVTGNRYINHISWNPYDGKYFISASDGFFAIKYLNGKWTTLNPDPDFLHPVYSVIQKDYRTLWLAGDNIAYKVELDDDQNAGKYFIYKLAKDFPERYFMEDVNDTVFLFTETGIHYYNSISDRFDVYTPGKRNSESDGTCILPLSNIPLVKLNDEWISLSAGKKIKNNELSLLKLADYIVSISVEDKTMWIIDGNNKLFAIDRLRSSRNNPKINVFVKRIYNDRGMSFNLQNVEFERGDNVVNFNIVAPCYLKQNTTQYQYFIYKVMPDWSAWSKRTQYEKAINKPGDYILQVRAKDLWGNISERRSVKFTIKAPFTKTILFYFLAGFTLLLLVILIIRFRERQLRSTTRLLEERVRERTAKIEAQKQEITSSIEYASRIQLAMLPMDDHFKEAFTDYFVLFKPREIVSGDFYWIGEDDRHIFFSVADCTGHGVPGAFMSTMGISTLNEIIANNRDLQANTVLNLLREKTKNALHQTGKMGEANDGMDVAFCVMHKNRRTLQFSGAFNPLVLIQGGELKEYRADRMPIGIHYGDERSFTNYVVNISGGDTVYIFSDGFSSQFGGPNGSKYKSANLKKLLFEIYYRPMVEQCNILKNELARWKGDNDQTDDITIIGVRI